MARMEVSGLEGLSDDLGELARLPDQVLNDVLTAMADVIVPAQQAEIRRLWNGPYSEGISAKSVKRGKPKKGRDGKSITIYPQGTRKRGKHSTSNAEIAFVNEYGSPRRGIAARPAVDIANKKAEKEAVEAGEKVYHAYLDSKNL